MSELIIAVLFGLGLAYFATQNTMTVPISLGVYQFFGVPLYLVAFGSLLAGLLIAWVIHLVGTLGFLVSLRNRDAKIREREFEMDNMKRKIRALEMENLQLKGDERVVRAERDAQTAAPPPTPSYQPNFFQRLRDNWFANRNLRQSY